MEGSQGRNSPVSIGISGCGHVINGFFVLKVGERKEIMERQRERNKR